MRALSIILNICLLLMAAYLISDSGFPDRARDITIFIVLISAPLISLFTIIRSNSSSEKSSGLISLYFQRKKLEEQEKIKRLKSDVNSSV
jgi:ABC-type glycerol-3-phosphate transport system permease component